MSLTSEVSDVAEVTDVKVMRSVFSRAVHYGCFWGCAPGIIPRAFHLDAALGVERKKYDGRRMTREHDHDHEYDGSLSHAGHVLQNAL